MKRNLLLVFFISVMTFSTASHAGVDWLYKIFEVVAETQGINVKMLTAQKSIDTLMGDLSKHMTGHSEWGTYDMRDYQSYGRDGENWSSLMQMAGKGGDGSALGQKMREISRQFPFDKEAINQVITDSRTKDYYMAQAQTIVATRAASQLDFDRVQEQIAYQKTLQTKIEETNDIKSAMDLSNRIKVEGNLIELAMLRQLALANQQQALNSQAEMNAALVNANFLK